MATIGAGSYAVQAVGNSRFVAIAASNPNTLHVFSKLGKRLLPPIMLSGKVENLKCNSSSHVVICTDDHLLSVFDIAKLKCSIQTSVRLLTSSVNLLRKDDEEYAEKQEIVSIAVTESGVPIVMVSSGSSYLYSVDLKSWTCIADHRSTISPFMSAIEKDSTATDDTQGISLSAIRRFAATSTPISAHVQDLQQNPHKFSIQTKEDLEIGLCAAQLMGSRAEYVHYLKLYARHLANNLDVGCLKELCDSLLGPQTTASSREWNPFVLGLSKRSLLMDIIAIMAENTSLQREAAEYRTLLDIQKQQQQQQLTIRQTQRSISNGDGQNAFSRPPPG